MKWKVIGLVAVVAGVLVSSVSSAFISTVSGGSWPETWPAALDPLREKARTSDGFGETVYEIRFWKREEFEAAWPHILALKSGGAPLTLLPSPTKSWYGFGEYSVGVRIRCPYGGELRAFKAHPLDEGPFWPNLIDPVTGELPAYVAKVDPRAWLMRDKIPPSPTREKLPAYLGRESEIWVPATPGDGRAFFYHRARVDIELIVDGDVVDLNRIALPQDAPIIDRRFPEVVPAP